MQNVKQILKKLISFKSVTPEDGGSIDYINNLLINWGFKSEIKIFGNNDYKVTNLYARLGNTEPNICFAGHVDVVDPGDIFMWASDPFIAREEDNKIYGRGAVDMKGAIAASLAACYDFINSAPQFKGSISFLLTSDEEGEAKYGTIKMLEYLKTKNELINLVILGEPASDQRLGDQIKIGRRGSINFTLKIIGTQGHVAYPDEASNPIHILINILHQLRNTTLDKGSEFFDASNLEITSIDVGNNTSNIIPKTAQAKFNIRFNDHHNYEKIMNFIRSVITTFTKEFELIGRQSAEAFIQQPQNLIKKFQAIAINTLNMEINFATNGGTSDARFIHKYYPVVEFGPKAGMAHKIDEYIENNDLQKLYKVYYNALCDFLK